jgi:hypothetical protein
MCLYGCRGELMMYLALYNDCQLSPKCGCPLQFGVVNNKVSHLVGQSFTFTFLFI